MPSLVQKRFSNPETFRKIRPDLLLGWLRPAEVYLAKRGVILPSSQQQLALRLGEGRDQRSGDGCCLLSPSLSSIGGEGGRRSGIDYDGLTRVFMEPTADMPAELAEGLHLVHEMGRPKHMDSMLEEARASGIELGLGDDATPEDVAIKLLLLDPRALESMHNCHQVTRARGYDYFGTDVSPVPRFDGPTLEQLRTIERRMEAFYVAFRRGNGTRVFSYCQQRLWQDSPEHLFLVRHGAPLQREEAMENGEPTSVLYRPRRYAVLKYDAVRGEMGVYCATQQERVVLLRVFGSVLFGRNNFFPGTAKFDLSPLVWGGRDSVAFSDVLGIEEVCLTEVEFCHREELRRREAHRAADIFTLVERSCVRWPKEVKDITRATFSVRLWRQRRPRRLTILPCNRAVYGRDADSQILERWMEARRFIKEAA